MNEQQERPTQTCSRCVKKIDCCCFCDEADCGIAICRRCLDLALGQALAQPHAHGG